LAGKEEKPNSGNLPPEITLHIGKDKITGIHITGQEQWVLVTVQGNRRSKSLNDGEQYTFAMSPVVAEPGLGLNSIGEVIDFIVSQSQTLGDTIVSMISYYEGQKLSDAVDDLLTTYSTTTSSFDVDDGGMAYAELAFSMGFSNMDPGDWISDVWLPHISKNYPNQI
jgi:hypothetical protein